MKLIVTSDLHFDIERSVDPTRAVAEEICSLRADGLLILGDVCGRDPGILSDCLHLFDRFAGVKCFVAGNHDIWVDPGGDSLDRLERVLPALCREAGFHPLDLEPVVLNGAAVVGSIGWYDYSYAPAWLGVPRRFYEQKVGPGRALRMEEYRHLVEGHDDFSDLSREIFARWMDGAWVSLGMSDEAFCDRLLRRLHEHLEYAATRAKRIVVGTHHVPFAEICPRSTVPTWAFASTYMGSARFGEVIRSFPQVRYAYSGHSHRGMCARIDGVAAINVGATYVQKLYDVVEI